MIIIIGVPCLFVGCLSTATIRAEDKIYPHTTKAVQFPVPAGWRLSPEGEFTASLVSRKREHAVVTLLASRNTWETQSEEKSVRDFLDYLQRDHDPNASLEIVGTFEAGQYGLRHVYHSCTQHNSFTNDWLAVFITQGPNAVDIEAHAPKCGGTAQDSKTIEAIARSITIKDI